MNIQNFQRCKGINVILYLFFIILITPINQTYADGKIYGSCVYSCKNTGSSYTIEQQQRRGDRDSPKYTTCRLKKILKSKYTNKQACIYLGGNKTYTLMYEKNCPKQYKCLYNPNSKEPNIDNVMESLRSIGKK